jgi:hypothetical protein
VNQKSVTMTRTTVPATARILGAVLMM